MHSYCHNLFRQVSIDRLWGYFNVLLVKTMLEWITLNIHHFVPVWESLKNTFFGVDLLGKIICAFVVLIFDMIKISFHSSCTNLYSYHHFKRTFFFPFALVKILFYISVVLVKCDTCIGKCTKSQINQWIFISWKIPCNLYPDKETDHYHHPRILSCTPRKSLIPG